MRDYRKAWPAIEYIKHFIGKWYKWGGDDPSGFDCSGVGVEFLKSVGKMARKSDANSRMLYEMFPKVAKPGPGVLAFWGDKEAPHTIRHVEICLNDWQTIGASGGGSKTLTEEDAIRDNAFIKVRPIERDRYLVGYCDPFLMVG